MEIPPRHICASSNEYNPAKVNVKINGTWDSGILYYKNNGAWAKVKMLYVKVNGVWKEAKK